MYYMTGSWSMSNELCRSIVDLDPGIRFAGIVSRTGEMKFFAYRNDVKPLLTDDEANLSTLQSIARVITRETFENKLGKALYSITVYENVKRATIPMQNADKDILALSFDTTARPGPIITKKILPLLKIAIGSKNIED